MSKRKSEREKLMAGTSRPDRKRTEPTHTAAVPTPPDWLPRYAKTVFRRTAKLLAEAGVLSQLDRDVLSVYSVAVSRWRDAEKAMDEARVYQRTRSGYSQVSAQYTVASRARAEVLSAAQQLGLSPTARARLEKVTPTSDADDPWALRNPFIINPRHELSA